MQAVRASGNVTTELRMAAALRAAGITGWRRQAAVFGNPDFVWRAERVALFVDGCFWHGCPQCNRAVPKTNAMFWLSKIARNRERDRQVTRELRRGGWAVFRVWEHGLRTIPSLTRLRKTIEQRSENLI
jgi:DNA mismatch endonuclease, patch repair protein